MSKLSSALVSCLIVALVASPFLMVVNAQAMPTPAVPEFSVGVVDHSYDVPPLTTTTTDPYLGNQVTSTQPGYHVENITIDVTIRNQPVGVHDHLNDLYFNIRYKGHYENNWTEPFHISGKMNDNGLLEQSGAEFTVYSMPQVFPPKGQVDFQVEAFIAIGHVLYGPFGNWNWTESGWSPIQTITIGYSKATSTFSSSITNNPYPSIDSLTTSSSAPTPAATISPSPTVPEFQVAALLIAVLAAVTLLLLFYKRKLTVPTAKT